VRRAQRREVLAGIGGFGALVELPPGYQRPVLVAGTDGVGTAALAIDTGRHDTIGIDLVAMCANDVVVQGAEPLFFLDYYATGKLRVAVAEAVVRGIVEAVCRRAPRWSEARLRKCPACTRARTTISRILRRRGGKGRDHDGSRVSAGDASSASPHPGRMPTATRSSAKLLAAAGATATTALEGHNLIDRLLTADTVST